MTPTSWKIKNLPQRNRPDAYGVLLVFADQQEVQIGMSSTTERGLRTQMSKHPDYKLLPEDRPPIGTVVERLPPISRCQHVATWVIVSDEPGVTTYACDEHLAGMVWDTDEVSPIECTAYAGRVIQCCQCGEVVLTTAAVGDDAKWPMPMPDLITQEGGEW